MNKKVVLKLLALLSVVYIAVAYKIQSISYIFYDDAYYYIDLVQDGSIFNPTADGLNLTTGYHPLWYFLLEFLSLFSIKGIYLPTILTSILLLISAYTFAKLITPMTKSIKLSMFYSIIVHSYLPILLLNFSGMEAPLVLLSLCLFLQVIVNGGFHKIGHTKYHHTFLLFATILFLSRTDMILIILPLFIYVLYNEMIQNHIDDYDKLKNTSTSLFAGIVSVVAIYLLWNYIITGHFTQSSTVIYSELRWSTVHSFTDYFYRAQEMLNLALTYFGNFTFSKFIFLGVIALTWTKVPTYLKFYRTGLIALLLVHCCIRFTFSPWYIIPFYLYFVLAIIHLIESKKDYHTLVSRGTAILALILFIGAAFAIKEEKSKDNLEIFDHWKKSGRQTDQIYIANKLTSALDGNRVEYPHWIGAFNSGKLGYHNYSVVNLDGLMNLSVIEAYDRGEGYQYLIDNEIFFIVDVHYYFDVFNDYIPKDSLELVAHIKTKGDVPTALYRVKGSPFTRLEALEWLHRK